MKSLRTIWAMGVDKRDEQYRQGFFHRLSQFLRVLWRSFPHSIFDFRLLSFPSQERILFALLIRPLDTFANYSNDFSQQILGLLHTYFEEYEWESFPDKRLPRLLKPFDLCHFVLLRRQSRWIFLEQPMVPEPFPMGFRPDPHPVRRRPDLPVWVVSHLAPDSVDWQTVCQLLLRQEEPILISVCCQPTSLTTEEKEFLQNQIFRCQHYALKESRPTLNEQAKTWQKRLWNWWCHMEDACSLIILTLASPKPISPPVYQTIGALMSHLSDDGGPIGSSWDVVIPDESQRIAIAEGITNLTPTLLPVFDAPQPAQRLVYLFDSVEACAVVLLPPAPPEPLHGVTCQAFRMQPPPCPFEDGVKIGVNCYQGVTKPVCLLDEDRRKHIYIVGKTGTGKTTLLQTMILHDIHEGHGVCVVDPHGDLFHQLLGKIPKKRMEDVIVIDPSDTDYPIGLNLLECDSPEQRFFVVHEVSEIITRLMEDEYGTAAGHMMGPLFHQHTRMNLLLVMSDPEKPGTLLQFYTIFQEDNFWKRWLPLKWDDPVLKRWVEKVLPMQDYTGVGYDKISLGDWIASKFGGLIFDPQLRLIFGQHRSTVNFAQAMNEGKIVLVNLSKGVLGITNARFFGMVLLTKLYAEAMKRAKLPEDQRRDFFIYVDEFHAVATQAFVNLLSEGRKFGVNLVLANQFMTQIRDSRIMDSILGNIGTLICFRLGLEDAERLEKEFLPVFTRLDLMNLPNWTACVRTLRCGQRVKPFTIQTEPNATPYDEYQAQRVRETSRHRYGRPRAKVEEEISKSLEKGNEVTR
jgi:energy-coupling factor transporter ATP-binding protein EcfA2